MTKKKKTTSSSIPMYNWNYVEQTPTEQFVNKMIDNVKLLRNQGERIRDVSSNKKKSNTANILQLLYKLGYFGNIDFNKAVDGIWGKKTETAYQKALADGYSLDGLRLIPNTNLSAIKEHKRKNNVKLPYVVIDKKNHKMHLMVGDKVAETHEVTTGANRGDGYTPLNRKKGIKYYTQLASLTGAGVYTVGHVNPTSRYLGHEPYFMLFDGNRNTNMSIHSPASVERLSHLNNGTLSDNNVSYGCVSPTVGVVLRWYDDKLLHKGDTIYVLPEMSGNYMYEDENGRITTHYKSGLPTSYYKKEYRKTYPIYYNTTK